MSDALEPASSIIDRFGGPDEVIRITGADRTRVYRWTQPKEKGGTGGHIPLRPASKLLQAAKERELPISAEDFIPTPEAAA